jgi:RimJ/RimL family protein N-acetyltransferase
VDVDLALVQQLTSACLEESAGEEFLTPPYGAPPYEELLTRYAPIERQWAGPVYRFPQALGHPTGTAVVARDHAHLLSPHLEAWVGDTASCQPLVVFLHEGRAVSVCGSVRTTPRADEAGVDTAPEFRRRGFAREAVLAWARVVRDTGRVPLYSTSWKNTASRALARRLGLVRFGSDLHFT